MLRLDWTNYFIVIQHNGMAPIKTDYILSDMSVYLITTAVFVLLQWHKMHEPDCILADV